MGFSISESDDTVEIPAASGKALLPLHSAGVEVDVAGLSDTGRVRPNNEDHFLITRFGRYMEMVQSNLPAGTLPPLTEERGFGLVVADGIGGSSAGEEASRMAIAGLVRLVLDTPDWILRLGDEPNLREVARRTAERYERIGRMLAEGAERDLELSGYGTTLTAAFSLGRTLFVGHVGDSRAYLLHEGRLVRLTRDHTIAQELLDKNHIDPLDAVTHRLRHVLTRSLGDHDRPVQPDVSRAVLHDGDRLLVCSDGLTEMLDESAITAALSADAPAAAICQELVNRANEAGGKDNITVAVARYRVT